MTKRQRNQEIKKKKERVSTRTGGRCIKWKKERKKERNYRKRKKTKKNLKDVLKLIYDLDLKETLTIFKFNQIDLDFFLWHVNLSWVYFLLSLVWFGLVWFYDISTIVGHFMLNNFYTYISNIWFLNTFCR